MVTKKKSMLRSLREWVLFYNFPFHTIFALFLFLTKDLLASWCAGCFNIKEYGRRYDLFCMAIYVMLIALWVYSLITDAMNKYYKKHTGGRNYPSDRSKFGRTFYELLDFYSKNEPQRMDTSMLPEIPWYQCSNALIFGMVKSGKKKLLLAFRSVRDGLVFFCWGMPGIGKTTAAIIPSARQFGLVWVKDKYIQKAAVMLTDLKGDCYAANREYRRIKRFSTVDWKNSCHFDPLAPIRDKGDEERAEFLDNLSVTIIPMISSGSSDNTYFVKVARGFFTAICLFCLFLDKLINFSDICLTITTKTYAEWGKEIEDSGYVTAMRYSNRFRDENPKNVGGGYSNLCDSVLLYTKEHMKVLFTDDGNCISPDDLKGPEPSDIYIQIDPTKMEVYSPLIAMLYQSFMASALSDAIALDEENKYSKEKKKHSAIAYIIDEFGQIPKMPAIPLIAQMGRGFNLNLFLCTQSMSSISQHYGEHGRKILMDCARGHLFLGINDVDTREWASRLIGEREVLKTGSSQSHSSGDKQSVGKSASQYRERAVKPEEFGILKDNDSLILYFDGHYTKGTKTYYYKD